MTKPPHIRSFAPTAVFLLISLVAAPFCLLSLLVVFNTVNPLQTVTLHSVRVRNYSGEDLLITPVGTMGRGYQGPDKTGTKHVLSQFLREWPAIPALVRKDLPLGDGAERVITYDTENMHFTDLVLSTRVGKRARVNVARYRGNLWETSVTNDVLILEPSSLRGSLDSQTAEAVSRQPRRDWFFIAALLPLPVCSISLGAALILIVRSRNSE